MAANGTCLKYEASLILGGVGDAMGYKNGYWEFCENGLTIHKDVEKLGGVMKLKIQKEDFMLSDDTIMTIATGDALVESSNKPKPEFLTTIVKYYQDCMSDMRGRSPGNMTCFSLRNIVLTAEKCYEIPFNKRAGGCGAAMRAVPIGLRYPREEQLDDLIMVSVEAGRITHHHPTGYLGSVAMALFASFVLQGVPMVEWGKRLMDTLPKVKDYVNASGLFVEENNDSWSYFVDEWTKYLSIRQITDGKGPAQFPEVYGVAERDAFYNSVSFNGWGGSSGHDAPMIAYDALLGSGDNWLELCNRAVLHGGDNDSTGIMACSLFGLLHGFKGVPHNHHKELENREKLLELAKQLYDLAKK